LAGYLPASLHPITGPDWTDGIHWPIRMPRSGASHADEDVWRTDSRLLRLTSAHRYGMAAPQETAERLTVPARTGQPPRMRSERPDPDVHNVSDRG